jgi:hypothetical protein
MRVQASAAARAAAGAVGGGGRGMHGLGEQVFWVTPRNERN